jgi:hypothetical protein
MFFQFFLDCTSPFEIYVTSDAKADTIAASATAISRGKLSTFLFCSRKLLNGCYDNEFFHLTYTICSCPYNLWN